MRIRKNSNSDIIIIASKIMDIKAIEAITGMVIISIFLPKLGIVI
ncbi:hypothetical protein [Butyrivibrio sp. VCD2006]|nr:hypothetical protein [Butyrivibrio sp. VCD2006]